MRSTLLVSIKVFSKKKGVYFGFLPSHDVVRGS